LLSLVSHSYETARRPYGRAGREINFRDWARVAILRDIEAGFMSSDQHFFRSQYIMFHFSEFLRLGGQQLDLKIHGFRPVAKDEQAHLRAGLVSILNMIPDPAERLVGLAYVKDRAFISNDVQVQLLPGSRAVLEQDELLDRNGDTAGYAVMFCIHIMYSKIC
jgi:hypothetical protein